MTKFYRMNGLGNQFNVFDLRKSGELSFAQIKEISEKKNIIEDYDQLILMLPSETSDCCIEIYNIDGSKAEACGNATRCVAHILCEEKQEKNVAIETINRVLKVRKNRNKYQVNMGKASLNWREIPLIHEVNVENLEILPTEKFGAGLALTIGNPHIVFFVKDLDKVDLEEEVSQIENHKLFPQGVNVNIAEISKNNVIKLKTWERGAGATKACGTGACATFFAAITKELAKDAQEITMPGGSLKISLNDEGEILMLGDANLEEQRIIRL